jgi:hypothetical protein
MRNHRPAQQRVRDNRADLAAGSACVESYCPAVHTHCHRQSGCAIPNPHVRSLLLHGFRLNPLFDKIVTKPQDVRLGFHRHAALLQRISSSVASSRQPIHIYKVKLHIVISGNEHADDIFVAVPPTWLKASERQT